MSTLREHTAISQAIIARQPTATATEMPIKQARRLFGIKPGESAEVMAERIRAHVCQSHLCSQRCTSPPCEYRSGGEAVAAIAALLKEDQP